MFLQKVYKHSKWLFLLMTLFIIMQVFINVKRGLVISPFFHYGMYSEAMDVKDNYPVFEVEVNGQKLEAKNFTPQQWDKVILPVQYYYDLNKSNALYSTDIKRLMDKVHISPDDKNYVQHCDSVNFRNWYQVYLGITLNTKIKVLNVHSRIYRFKSGHLQPTDSTILLSQACN